MTDITLKTIASGYNLNKINDNFVTLEDNINNTSIQSTGGNNVMSQDFDMNSKRIINLPAPVSGSEPIRLSDAEALVSQTTGGSTISETPPIINTPGDRWTRCSDMKAFLWYVDVDGGQWIEDRPSYGIDTIQNLTLPYTFKTVALMQASTIVFPVGKKIVWQGYTTESDGGSNWGLVTSGAHTDDGGSVFTLADGQYIAANLNGDVSVKKFGCKVNANSDTTTGTPTGDDDYAAFYSLLKYTTANGVSAKLAEGNMLIGSTIDVDSLNGSNLSILGTNVRTGRTYTSQLKGKAGLSNMFTQAFSATLTNQRPVTLKGFGVISEDPWLDQTLRAPLRAFDLYSCPQSHFENLFGFGITSLLHTRACWLSSFIDIVTNRCKEGIFCDGEDNIGSYGWADHCSFDRITNSGWTTTFGLRLRGCKAAEIGRVDGETGDTGSALVLEGVKDVETGSLYMEAFSATVPIVIKPIDGSSLDNLDDFSTGIKIGTIHGLSNFGGTVVLHNGCLDIEISKVRVTRFDIDNGTRTDEAGEWLKLSGVSAVAGVIHTFQNIKIDGAYSNSDNPFSLLTNSVRSQAFNLNGNIIQRQNNVSFYGQTMDIGIMEVNTVNNTRKLVTGAGTISTALAINASTTINSRLVTVDSAVGLYAGTLVTIGAQTGLRVTSIDRSGLKVFLGQEITSTQASVAMTYTAPTYTTFA